ncbi:hypothetical protein M0R04_09550, partial [Candidatus Dojkabacteria bacterium]|nr:hypothetical protein [Candidatus Dojkabacteria bacterium]
MTDEITPIPQYFSQITLRLLGSYCSTYLGNEMYYLVRAIRILLEVIGEKKVKRLWEKEGYNWEKTEKLLKRA